VALLTKDMRRVWLLRARTNVEQKRVFVISESKSTICRVCGTAFSLTLPITTWKDRALQPYYMKDMRREKKGSEPAWLSERKRNG
jgi:hypothetical protein